MTTIKRSLSHFKISFLEETGQHAAVTVVEEGDSFFLIVIPIEIKQYDPEYAPDVTWTEGVLYGTEDLFPEDFDDEYDSREDHLMDFDVNGFQPSRIVRSVSVTELSEIFPDCRLGFESLAEDIVRKRDEEERGEAQISAHEHRMSAPYGSRW